MKITYSEINGRKYAYTCTSKRVPGKKNPVCVRTYLGTVDPETGEIIRKRCPRPPTDKTRFDVRDYGDSAIISSIINRLGLVEELSRSFGSNWKPLILCAAAQAIHPSNSDSIIRTVDHSLICELLHTQIDSLSMRGLEKTMRSIDPTELLEYMNLRLQESTGRVVVFIIPVTTSNDANDQLYSLREFNIFRDMAIAWAIGPNGPVAFKIINDLGNDDTSLDRALDLVKRVNDKITLALDSEISSHLDLIGLVLDGVDIVFSVSPNSSKFLQTMEHLNSMGNIDSQKDRNKALVSEEMVGIVMDESGYRLIFESDPTFREYGVLLHMYVDLDKERCEKSITQIKLIINNIKNNINTYNTNNYKYELDEIIGAFGPLLKISTDKSGTIRISVVRNEMQRYRRRMETDITLATTYSHEDILSMRTSRSELDNVINEYYRKSRNIFQYSGKSIPIMHQLFIEYLVIRIYYEIRKTLISSDIDLSVSDALYLASTVKITLTPEGAVLSKVDDEARTVLEAFGISPDNPPPGIGPFQA